MDDRAVRRAGLDYWPEVKLSRHSDLEALYSALPQAPLHLSHDQSRQGYLTGHFNRMTAWSLAGKPGAYLKTSCERIGRNV